MYLVIADHSVQCQAKSDGVRSTTVEKVDAGTLDRCQGSSVFPLHVKQQPSEPGHVPIYNNGKFAPASLLRHPRRDVTYIAFQLRLNGKGLLSQGFS